MAHNEMIEIGKFLSDLFGLMTTLNTAMVGVVIAIIEKVFTPEEVFRTRWNVVLLISSLISFIFSIVISLFALAVIPNNLKEMLVNEGGIWVNPWLYYLSIIPFVLGVVLFTVLAIVNFWHRSQDGKTFRRLAANNRIYRTTKKPGKIMKTFAIILICCISFVSGCSGFAAPSQLPTKTITPSSIPPTATKTPTATITNTPSPTLTITPSPTLTPAVIFPVKPYTILYDFDETDIDPIFSQQIPESCSLGKKDDILTIQCTTETEKDIKLRYIPRVQEELRGVAMLAHVDSPYEESWGRVSLMVTFAKPNNPDERVYTISLRKGIVKVVEYYPSRDWTYTVLGGVSIPVEKQDDFHLVQIEFIDGNLQFLFDNLVIPLDIQPDLPNGYNWKSWKLETVLFKRPANETKTLIAQIDWFAILK